MRFMRKIKILLTGLMVSSFAIVNANNTDISDKACIDKDACPKMLEISLIQGVARGDYISKKENKIIKLESIEILAPLLINNKSNRALTSMIVATHGNSKVNCGQFTIPGKSSLQGELFCNVQGIPYTLSDKDGRSNIITVSDTGSTPGPCEGKSVNDECLGGIIFQTDGVHGLITSKASTEMLMSWYPSGSSNEYLGIGVNRSEGSTNTDIVTTKYGVYGSSNKYAAGYCRSLGSQWYLPADNELNELYAAKNFLTSTTFQSEKYWSSTECYGNGTDNGGTGGIDCDTNTSSSGNAARFARTQNLGGGFRDADEKFIDSLWVRCIQAF